MTRMRSSVALLALSFLALSSPGSGAGPAKDDKAPRVELLNAGREPRVPLRYEFRQGLKETLEIEMDSSLRVQVGRQASPMTKLPTTYLVFSMDYEEVTDAGDLRYSFVLEDARLEERADLEPAAVEEVRRETEKLVGTKGWALVTSLGVTKDGATNLPADADASVRQKVETLDSQLRQLSAPLPEEPVGEGARWSVTTRLKVSGVEVDQTIVFRLLSLRDGKAVLNVKGIHGAEPQRMTLPDLPAGAKARLESLAGKASGTLMLDFASAIPRLDCDMGFTMECTVEAEGRTASFRLEMETRTGIHRTVAALTK